MGVVDQESDLVVYSVSKYMGASEMGCYTYEQFKTGCELLSCSDMV